MRGNARRKKPLHLLALGLILCLLSLTAAAEDPWVVYAGGQGPGAGRHIVLISGDEEYRSEEALPQLGKILATHHGFTCTVLFAINANTGHIDPNWQTNIPGLDALDKADLMIIFTRFRNLPDDQMQAIDRYLVSGRPVIGMRTATHAFQIPAGSPWAHYGNDYAGEKKEWEGGFGRLILGEKWISHHGVHKAESTHGLPAPGAEDHAILRGIAPGSIWGPTDVYGVRLPLPGDSRPIVLGQVTARAGAFDSKDVFYGMRPTDNEAVPGEKNDPMMPIAWTKTYQVPGGKQGRVFTTTMGASTDLVAEGTRRMLVNAVYWCLGMEEKLPKDGAKVELVGQFEPTRYEFRPPVYWKNRAMTVSEWR